MRTIPVDPLVVTVTAQKVQVDGRVRWRGHWSVHPNQAYRDQAAVAQGDSDLHDTEEHAQLFAGTEGVAMAKDIAAKLQP